ncbi:hypothetical protein EPO05_06450 [Patescibacteria group bacterium]|nr:MAG: hypothetical protein EPO05_06450 [Patescibacteria group bacterium]
MTAGPTGPTQPGQPRPPIIVVPLLGLTITMGADSIDEDESALESGRMLANGILSVNYPYLPQQPDLIKGKQWTFHIPRAAINTSVYWEYSDLMAWRGYFSLVRWKGETEVFTVPSGAWSPQTLRAPFKSVIDSGLWPAGTQYDTVAMINSTPTTFTAGTVAATGRTAFTLGDTPDPGDIVRIRYVPSYLAKIDWQQSGASKRPLKGSEPLKETRDLIAVEINTVA